MNARLAHDRGSIPQPLLDLADPGSVDLLCDADGSAVVTAAVRVRGVPAVCYATEGRVRGGALTSDGCDRIVAAIEYARSRGVPVVGIWHSGGAALQEGIPALDGVARLFRAIVAASGQVPQISVVLGPAAGGAAYGAALTDVVVMTGQARLFVTGPAVVGQVTGQRVSAEDLGGAEVHGRYSGVAHVVAADTADALARTATLVELVARPGAVDTEAVRRDAPDPGLRLPASPRQAYDVRPLVADLLDGAMFPLQERHAANVVTALGRLGGATVGVVANNPLRRGGCLDAAAGDKAARFVRFCDAFGIPLVVVVDVPGYLPGLDEERHGVIRRGAKLLHAFAACTVPRVTVVTRKAYGGAYVAMNSKFLGATAVLAWPTADMGIMNATAAVDILYRQELSAYATTGERDAARQRLAVAYQARAGGLASALEGGSVDAVVEPAKTRAEIGLVLAHRTPTPCRIPNIPL